jgi:hypothetical protein
LLASNAFAQAEALMKGIFLKLILLMWLITFLTKGKSFETAYNELSSIKDESVRVRLAHHKTFPGNRPSNMIIVDQVFVIRFPFCYIILANSSYIGNDNCSLRT